MNRTFTYRVMQDRSPAFARVLTEEGLNVALSGGNKDVVLVEATGRFVGWGLYNEQVERVFEVGRKYDATLIAYRLGEIA